MDTDIAAAYEALLQQVALDVSEGHAIWRRPEVIAGGLPRRKRERRTYTGVNVLLLWHVQRSLGMAGKRLAWRPAHDLLGKSQAVVVSWRPDQDPPFFRCHGVGCQDARRRPLKLDRSALAQLLYDLEAATSRDDGERPLARAIAQIVRSRQRPLDAWDRTEPHRWLRKSMKAQPAETLIGDLCTAFALAWLNIPQAPPSKLKLPPVKGRQLAVAAHVAWELFETVRHLLRQREFALFPELHAAEEKTDRGPVPPGLKASRVAAQKIVDELRTHRALLTLFPCMTQDQARRLEAWLERAPYQAAARLADFIHERGALPDDPASHVQALLEIATPPTTPAAIQHDVLVESRSEGLTLEPTGEDPATGTTGPNWRSLGSLFRRWLVLGPPPHATAMFGPVNPATADAWRDLRVAHWRATWIHRVRDLDPAALHAIGLPWEEREVERVAWPPSDLWQVGACIGRSPRRPLSEERVLGELAEPFDDIATARRANRALRRWMAASGPLHPNQDCQQLSLFDFLRAKEPVEPPSWPRLLAMLLAPDAYRTTCIPKRKGAPRRLDVPRPALMAAQRRIAQALARYFPGTAAMAAFQPHRSVAWHARMHAGARHAVMMDIASFFGSVRPHQVRPWLEGREYLPRERLILVPPFAGWSEEGRQAVLDLLFHSAEAGGQPFLAQGAPSSPVAANLAAVAVDRWVQDAADAAFGPGNWRYSRYADDLVLSTSHDIPDFGAQAEHILAGAMTSEGWRPNRRKTHHWRAGSLPLMVCGIKVPAEMDQPLALPRDVQRRVRAAVHRLGRSHGQNLGATSEDQGLVAYAFAVTGDPALLAWQSRRVRRLAEAVAGYLYTDEFIAGWGTA